MSHAATRWLSEIPPTEITAGEFRVLFHLCDCHNPSFGCFPDQEYLRDKTGLSNGGLNNALSGLEAKGFIYREKRRDDATKKQISTRYILSFEGIPSPLSGDGAVSTFEGEPSPLFDGSRLHSTGVIIKGRTGNRTCNRTSKRVCADDLFNEEQAPKVDLVEEVLARFYDLFPKRTDGKYSTPSSIRPKLKAALKKVGADELMIAVQNYAATDLKGGAYAMKAANWLRDEEWQKYMTGFESNKKSDHSNFIALQEEKDRKARENYETALREEQERQARRERWLAQQGVKA